MEELITLNLICVVINRVMHRDTRHLKFIAKRALLVSNLLKKGTMKKAQVEHNFVVRYTVKWTISVIMQRESLEYMKTIIFCPSP